jgi:hypothetical protein
MEMFDAPEGIASCSRRPVSTVALQPLFMLNSQFMARRATALAQQVAETAGDDIEQQIETAFRRTLSRLPTQPERQLARQILVEDSLNPNTADAVPATPDSDAVRQPPDGRLMQLCHALLNLNEFVYIP